MAKKKGLPLKELQSVLDKLRPDLKEVLQLLEKAEMEDDESESVLGDLLEKGVRNILIARKIIKKATK